MWTGSHLLFQCKDPTDKTVCESWQPVSAMRLDQSTDMLLTLQQRSPKYFSTTRRKKKKKSICKCTTSELHLTGGVVRRYTEQSKVHLG